MSGAFDQPLPLARRQAKPKRPPLLASCAVAAAMVAVGYGVPVRAQSAPVPNPSYLASSSVVGGDAVAVVASGTSPATPFTFINLRQNSAIIDWTPSNLPDGEGVIAFQNGGQTIFEGPSGGYTVLNRIDSGSASARFNGSTSSYLGSSDGGLIGGNIWFYIPGGIIAGSNASFDVGSLLLSTNQIMLDSEGGLPTGTVRFQGSGNGAAIRIDQNASLTAHATGGYIALVAPRIIQAGTVTVDGTAAYVAADAVDITFNTGGLFDIAVTVGSSGSGEVLTHTGRTESASAAGPLHAYLVAVPASTAISMLVQGSLGVTATNAAVVDGAVILSAGQGVSGGVPNSTPLNPESAARINLETDRVGSTLLARAATNILATGPATGPSTFGSNVTLEAGTLASLTANTSQTVTIGGNLVLDASAVATSGDATGGTAALKALGGAVTVAGFTSVLADGIGASGETGGTGRGGNASVTVNGGGTLTLTGGLLVQAFGAGGHGFTDRGGDGHGGTIAIINGDDLLPSSTAGNILVNGVRLDARGFGGDAGDYYYSATGDGGDGFGGKITVTAGNGQIRFFDTSGGESDAEITASGWGGDGGNGGNGTGGGGAGALEGGVTITTLAGGTGSIDISDVPIDVSGTGGSPGGGFGQGFEQAFLSEQAFLLVGGSGGDGGAGTGGFATIDASGGTISLATLVHAEGFGASGAYSLGSIAGGNGGDGTGGTITIGTGGGTLDLANVSLLAQGEAGDGGYGDNGSGGGNGGSATGGTVTINAGESDLDLRFVGIPIDISAIGGDGGYSGISEGPGGNGGNGGSAIGGKLVLSASDGGTLLIDPESLIGDLSHDAIGGNGEEGDTGTTGGNGGNGGSARGSTLEIAANLGTVTFESEAINSVLEFNARGGDGGDGGTGSDPGDSGGDAGHGGEATGGTISVNVNGGLVDLGSNTLVAYGTGGAAGVPGAGGAIGEDRAGFGGTVSIVVNDDIPTGGAGSARLGDTVIEVDGFRSDESLAIGGRIEIYDRGSAPDGGLQIASLEANSFGSTNSVDQATGQVFDLFSASRRIIIDGSADITHGGPAYFRAQTTGGLNVGGSLTVDSGSFISIRHDPQPAPPLYTIEAGTSIDLEAFGSITGGGSLRAGGDIEIDAGYDLTDFLDDDNHDVTADSSVTVGAVTSTGGEIDIEATGLVSGGTFLAGHELTITALNGGVTLASGTAGFAGEVDTLPTPTNRRSIGILAAGDVTVAGSATARFDIGMASHSGSIDVGSVDAGRSAVFLASDQVTLGPVTAPGLLYISNSSLLEQIDADPTQIEAADLLGFGPATFAATGGDVTISGPVSAGPVVIFSGGSILFADLQSSADVQLRASQLITGNSVSAGGDIWALGEEGLNIGSANANGSFTGITFRGGTNSDSLIAGNDIGLAIDGGDVIVGAMAAGGDIDVRGSEAIEIGSATATGFETEGGLSGGQIEIHASRSLTLGTGNAGADIWLENSFLGDITSDELTAGGSIRIFGNGGGITLANGDAGDLLGLHATDINLGTGRAGDSISAGASGNLNATDLVAGRIVSLIGVDSVTVGSAQAGQIVSLLSDGIVTLETIDATGSFPASDIFVDVQGGVGIDAQSIRSAGTVDLTSSSGAITVATDLAAEGLITAQGTSLTLNSLGDLDLHDVRATSGNLTVDSGGDLGLEFAHATDSALFSAGGDITIIDTLSGGNLVSVTSGGDITVSGSSISNDEVARSGQVRSDGDIVMRADGGILIQADGVVGLGAAAAPGGQSGTRLGGPADSVLITAGQTLSVEGTIQGLAIELASADISIGRDALIGDENSDILFLTNNGGARTFIGGSGDANGYALSNAEFGRVQAARIIVFGPEVGGSTGSAGLADVTIQTLDLLGSLPGTPPSGRRANLVGGQSNTPSPGVLIHTNGSVRVEGDVALASAGPDDLLTIAAGERIDLVVAPSQGSIVITGAPNELAGTLELIADTVQVSTAQAAQDIAALADPDDLDAIDERLGTNDGGVLKPEGYLQANTLKFSVSNALYIQNSGGPGLGSTARAGFTAGSGGVSIDTFGEEYSNGEQFAKIVINGRQTDGTGFIGGADLIPLLSINGDFDLRSTANGCLIVGLSCRFDLQTPDLPVRDVVEEIVDAPENQDGTAVVQALNPSLIQLVGYDGLRFEPLIDDPVTGTGNDDLWLGEKEKDDDGK